MIVKKLKFLLNKKSRSIPKRKRKEFKETVLIMRDRGRLLFLTKEEWNRLVTKRLTGLKGRELQEIKRLLFGSTFPQKIDKRGRITLPVSLWK